MLNKTLRLIRKSFPKLISLYLVVYMFASPLLVLSTSSVFALDEPIQDSTPVVQQEVVEPSVQPDVPTPIESVTPDEVKTETPKPIVTELENVEVTIADSGVGALNTIVENVLYDCNATSTISCVTTDKSDYSPIELVTLSGYSYLPNTQYSLVIYSTNTPTVRHQVTVLTDSKGSFEYKYQLDGKYRPQYYVEVSSLLGEVIATGSFTDGRLIDAATLNGVSSVNVAPNTSVNVSLTVTTSGSSSDDDWRSTSYKIGSGSTVCVDNTNGDSDGTYTRTFSITAPSTSGSYNVTFIAYENDNCGSGSSTPKVLTNGIVVAEPQVVSNPVLSQSCGIDVGLIIDTSSSIDDGELAQMKTALTTFVNAFTGTPTQMAVVSFDDNATLRQNFTSNLATVNSAINGTTGSGYTNWEDALLDTRNLFPNRGDKPDLIVFTSDGNPTASSAGSNDTDQPNAHLAPAIAQANAAKSAGIRIISLGIGSDISATRLQQISSADAYYSSANFATLTSTLQQLVTDLCGGTISVTKLIDDDGNIQTTNDRTPASNWNFNVGGTNRVTDANGQTTPVELNNGTYSVSETLQSGYSLIGATCTGASNNGSKNGNSVNGIQIDSSDIVSCTFINTPNYTPGKICHATGNPNQWVENTPATLGQLMGHVGESHQNGNDIIPPVPVFLPSGQNWDAQGQAIWNNNCNIPVTDVKIVKSDSPDPVINGGVLTYTLTVSNLTAVVANSVVVTDTLPTGFTVTSVVPSVGSCSDIAAPTISCELGNLNGNASATVTISGNIDTQLSTISNTASVSTSTNETNTNNNQDEEGTTVIHNGTITVNKVVVPSNDTGLFNLTINGTPYANNVGNGGTTGSQSVVAGTYTVGETAGTLTDLNNYNVTYSGACNGTDQVIVGSGENKVCTITNTRKTGNIEFVKVVEGGESIPTDWMFNVTNIGTFANGTFSFNTGSYEVKESSLVLGYSLIGVSGACSTPVWPDSATLLVTENGGTCTFTNRRDTGSIKVNKLLDSDGNGSFETLNPNSFKWSLDGIGQNTMGSTINNITTTVGNVVHNVNENMPSGFKFVGWFTTSNTQYSCANPEGTIQPISVSVLKNQTSEITLCNQAIKPKLTVTKIVNGDAQVSSFPLFVGQTQVTSGEQNSFNVGTYTVSETNQQGYTGVISGDCAINGLITLNAGDVKSCVITNTRDSGSLKVNKRVDLNGDGDWNDSNENSNSSATNSFTWSLDGSGTNVMGTTKANIPTGSHQINENAVTNYHFVGWYVTGQQGKSCTNLNGTTLPVSQNVIKNQTTEITLCNGRDTGTVTIVKDAINNDTKDFDFDTNLPGLNGDFELEDDGNNNDGERNYITRVVPTGSYWVEESNTSDWKLTTLVCVGDNNTTWDVEDRTVDLHVEKNENITCTFTNTKLGKIEGVKFYDKDGDKYLDQNEQKLGGWKIFIDENDNQTVDQGEEVDTTSNGFSIFSHSYMNSRQGEYEFDNLLPGTYSVCEELQEGWYNSTPICQEVTVNPGQTLSLNFGNYQPLTINAHKIVCNTESELPNWGNGAPNINSSTAQNFVNSHPNCSLEAGWDFQWGYDGQVSNYNVDDQTGLAPSPWELLGTTDSNGFTSTKVTSIKDGDNRLGNLWVRENLKPGYVTFSYPSNNSYSAEIYCHVDGLNYDNYDRIDNPQFGDTYNCVAFNAKKTGDISITKDVLDPDGNPVEDTTTDFTVNVDELGSKSITDNQTVVYENLPVGTYTVTEELNGDYTFDSFSKDLDNEQNGAQVEVTEEGTTNVIVYNRQKKGAIIVRKEVIDAQGSDEATSEQEFNIVLNDEITKPISDNGENSLNAEFEDLNPATYNFNETAASGFTFQGCYRTDLRDKELNDYELNNVTTTLRSNETQNWTCINQAVQANLDLIKTNNRTGVDLIAGDDVTYTLTVTAPSDDVIDEIVPVILDTPYVINDVKVTDLAPKGFEYVNGTWTATSSVRGDLKTALVTGEPIYNNVGVWELGDMVEGEVVTLTYQADISTNQDAGLYKDLAWTQGTDVLGDRIIGTAPMGLFAGTQVNVVEEVEDGKAQVLGISLPNTGAQWLVPLLSLLAIISGFVLMMFGLKNRKKASLTIVSVLGIAFLNLLSADSVKAASGLSVRVEQPKTLYNKENMKLGFVALDIDNRPVTVQCQQKGPGDVSFTNVGSAINLGNGGSNGDCVLNSSILDNDGTYEFKVIATAGLDQLSESVSMTLDTNAPSPVLEYVKTKDSCKYTLKFTTSNDGQTTKVQIFRSTQTSFIANASTLVVQLPATSNDHITYEDTVPNCDTEYFYAIRAIDVANNASVFTTDSLVVVTPTPVEDTDGEVQGSEDTDKGNNDNNNGTDNNGNGEVKGEEDNNNKDENKIDSNDVLSRFTSSWGWIVGIILSAFVLWILQRTGILQKVFQKLMTLRRR